MADESVTVSNSASSVNSDYVVAVDTVAGKEYQIVKLDVGADGAVARLVAGQATMSASVPVAIASNQSAIDVAIVSGSSSNTEYAEGATAATITGVAALMEVAGNELRPVQGTVADGLLVNLGANNDITGTVTANAGTNLNTSLLALESGGNLDTISSNVGTMAVWDASSRCKVSPIAGQVGVAGGSGVDGATVQRVTLATDVPLPTGSNTIGAVTVSGVATAANQSTIIGHLDGVEGLLATIDADTGALAACASGTELQVDIVTSALPTGAATSANQTTIIGHVDGIEGLLTTIDADTSNLATIETNTDFGTVTGGGTETGALRVTIANNSTGVVSVDDNGSTLSVDDGGGSITVDGTVAVSGTVTVAAHAVTNAGTFAVQNNGHGKTVLSAGGSASTSGNNTLIAAGSARLKVKAFSLTTQSTTAITCIFQSGAGGTELWRVVLQAPSGASTGANLSVPAPDWLFATASATLLNLNLSSANAVHWSVSYYDEA